MPNILTPRQREYLAFIRQYIEDNECAPRLAEIAKHFIVTSPTANKTLNVLQDGGHLYFDRDKASEFYIRIPERHTSSGVLREIPITGNVDKYGEVLKFPNYHGHFPFVLSEDVGHIFALDIYQHMPSVGILSRDYMIFSIGGIAQPGDICIYPYGKRKFLVRMYAFGPSEDAPFHIMAMDWMEQKEKHKDHLFW